jgi:hypothetical protein
MALVRAHSAEAFFAHPYVARHHSIRDQVASQLTRTTHKRNLEPTDRVIADREAALEQAWSSLIALAGFGILERFEDSRRLLNAQLGLAMPAIPPRQVLAELAATHADLVPIEPDPLTDALDRSLDRLTEIDRPLYARAQILFAQRLAAL